MKFGRNLVHAGNIGIAAVDILFDLRHGIAQVLGFKLPHTVGVEKSKPQETKPQEVAQTSLSEQIRANNPILNPKKTEEGAK